MKFTFETTDDELLSALTAAREARNADNPQAVIETDQAFFAWFVASQFEQWVKQYTTGEAALRRVLVAAKEADIDGADALVAALYGED